MTLPPPVQKARARLDRNLEDACVDLAWLMRLYAGSHLGMQMAQLHTAISAMREVLAQDGHDRRAAAMTPQERKDFADVSAEAIVHPLVQQVIDEYRDNMKNDGVDLSTGTLARYGLFKCLNAATQVARAMALGIDPQELVMSDQEAGDHMMRQAQVAHEAGKPVIIVQGPDRPEPQETP